MLYDGKKYQYIHMCAEYILRRKISFNEICNIKQCYIC